MLSCAGFVCTAFSTSSKAYADHFSTKTSITRLRTSTLKQTMDCLWRHDASIQYQRTLAQTDGIMKTMLMRLFWPQLLIGTIAGLIAAGLSYTGPIFINLILAFIAKDNATSADQHRAYMFAGIWTGSYLLEIFFDQQSQWNCIAVSMKAEQAIQTSIHMKMMKLAP